MQTPTIEEIEVALRKVLKEAVGKDAKILSEWQRGNPDANGILIIHAVNPGRVRGAEMGGPEALSQLLGVYNITLSYQVGEKDKGNKALYSEVKRLAQRLIKAFYRQSLPTASGCSVYVDEPYTTNVGATPDGRRAQSVAVPWHTWAGGYQEE